MYTSKSRGAFIVLLIVEATAVYGQQTSAPPYDGIQAGFDAFRLAEEQRQAGVADQVALIDQARFWNGYPTSRGTTIFGYTAPAPCYYYPLRYAAARQSIGQWQMQTAPNRWESHPIYDPPLVPYQPLPAVVSPLLDRTPYAPPRIVQTLDEWIPPPLPMPAEPTIGEAVAPRPPQLHPKPRGPREY